MTIISGITSSDVYSKHFAFGELRQLATEDSDAASTRRVALFSDQKYNPSMWSTLARTVLLTLGDDYQLFLRRGKPAPPRKSSPSAILSSRTHSCDYTAPPPAAAPKPEPPQSIPKTPLVRAPIIKPKAQSPIKSALETLASDGAITNALTSTAEAGATHLPELFRSVMPERSVDVAGEAAKKGEEIKQAVASVAAPSKWKEHVCAAATRRLPAWAFEATTTVQRWWTGERLSKVVQGALPNRKMDRLAIECALDYLDLTIFALIILVP